jgi:hypothetical protein
VAAPAETRTPNLHRAKIAPRRVRMEGWRQWRLGGRKNRVQRKNKRTHLTPTRLLMEGDYTQNPPFSAQTLPNRSEKEITRRHGTSRRTCAQFSRNSLKAACLLGFYEKI